MEGEKEKGTETEDFLFLSLILMFRSSALIGLGEIPDPITNETKKDIGQVEQSISLLEMLEKKTQGNLAPGEELSLRSALYELRMKYVQGAKDEK